MKKLSIVFITLIICTAVFVYWIGTKNFYLGSANYYQTAFNLENSKWYCDELSLTAELKKADYTTYMAIGSTNSEAQYLLFPRGNWVVELYNYSDMYAENEPLNIIQVKYKKRFGKVYAFQLLNIDKNNLENRGNDSAVFTRHTE